MAHIDDVPAGVTGAGQDFDYVAPPLLADVVLVNAPLDPSHANVGLNRDAYDTFIEAEIDAGRAWNSADHGQIQMLDPEHDLVLPIKFEDALTFYNYGRVTINDRAWYVFYSPRYLNKTSTRFVADIDEFPSFSWSLGYSHVQRSHYAVAASAAGDISYCLEPEPVPASQLVGYSGYNHDPLGTAAVLVISTVDLRADAFVPVDNDVADTASSFVTDTFASGTVDAPQPVGAPQPFPYVFGNDTYEDPFYYPYAASPGLSTGNQMYRPFVTGATPSLVDGIAAEGGAFVYSSIAAYVDHMAQLAHTPWMVGGISRAVLIPGGSGGSFGPTTLSPYDEVVPSTGAPTYHETYSTSIGYDVELAADWLTSLPAAYSAWTKLRTAPFSSIELGNRQGAVREVEPQLIPGLGALQLHIEGAFHPEADVAAWLTNAGGTSAANEPMEIPLDADLPHFEVGRDAAFAPHAASTSAQRSQSIFDMLMSIQRASVDNTFTLSSSFMATQYAIAEAI
jgi:hypothetical protein